MGAAPVVIILAAVGVCVILAALVYTGRLTQKGPHRRGGPLDPQARGGIPEVRWPDAPDDNSKKED